MFPQVLLYLSIEESIFIATITLFEYCCIFCEENVLNY